MSKSTIIAFTLFISLFTVSEKIFAQSVTVDATIDSLQILIGKQAKIKLQVSFDAKLKPVFPHPKDSLVHGVEIVEIAKPDIQYLNNKQRLLVTNEYTVTSFEAGLYYIPPFKINIGGKTYASKALALKVISVPVDIKHPDRFFAQKDVVNPPFMWDEWAWTFFISILAIPLLFLIIFLIMRLRDNKPIIKRIKVEPQLPPHQQAMSEIERVKSERIWQKGLLKEYYTELTDILRTYIQNRFGFNAMEMTSSEIIEKIMEMEDTQMIKDLKSLFQTADLVKFAKHVPMMNENDANLLNAIQFVDETKMDELPKKPVPEEITIIDKRSRKAKMLLILGILLLSVLVIVILFFVGAKISSLFF